jgi:hypothetical protein
LLDNKSLKSSCDNLEAAFKKDGKSDIDANELYMELKFIQDFMPKENMGPIEILKLGYISMPQVNIHCVGNHLRSWFFEILDFWGPDA